jgi:gliding motility-associated-like protein
MNLWCRAILLSFFIFPLLSFSQSIPSFNNSSLSSENCTNGIDDDGDGLIDCLDPDCLGCNMACGPVPSLRPQIFNTANNGNGGLITLASEDLHWTISNTLGGSERKAIYTGNCANGQWTPSPFPDAGWITDPQFGVCGNIIPQNAETPRYFNTKFDLPASVASSLSLSFDVYADNYVGEVYVNGVAQGIRKTTGNVFCAGCNLAFTLNKGFIPGTNTITILVLQMPIPEYPLGQNMGLLLNASATLDSDKDGVADGKDKCPGTPAGVTVDADGCFNLSIQATKSVCEGETISLKAANAGSGSSYAWTLPNGQTNTSSQVDINNAMSSNSGAYNLEVTTSYNCVYKNSVSVSVNSLPSVLISSNQTICRGNSVQLTASGGTSYQWAYVGDLSNTTIANPVAKPLTTTTYNVTAANANGCKKTASTTISVNQPSPVTASLPVTICSGGSTQLTSSGPVSFLWYPSSGLNNAGIANPIASPSASTQYTVVGTSSNGCKDSSQVLVTVKNIPVAVSITPNSSICVGDSLQLNVSAGNSFKWTPTTGLNNPNIQNPKAGPGSTITYQVDVLHTNGCSSTAATNIKVNNRPTASVPTSFTICEKDTVLINASGGSTYLWQPTTGLSDPYTANPRAFPKNNIAYSVIVANADGCKDTAYTSVSLLQRPLLFLGHDTSICIGNTITYNASINNGAGYLWNTGSTTPTILANQSGTYIVEVKTSECIYPTKDTARLTVIELPLVELGKDTSLCNFIPLTITPKGKNVENYLWNTGSRAPSLTVTNSGIYSITASNQCGQASDQISIVVNECADDLFFPSAFTPTKDGKNEVFKALYYPGVIFSEYHLKVYDRWGRIVFETSDPAKGWNGVYNNNVQSTNTFVWQVQYKKGNTAIRIIRKGTVTLIK